MNRFEVSDERLFEQAKEALSKKDFKRADALFSRHAERRLSKVKDKVANDQE
jgi:hypothetical protein